MTYGQLNASANRLAHYLRSRGIGPEKLLGLCVERSLEMLVGILGILKAGGAYLPIDPNYPRERVGFMIGDAAPGIVLTQEVFAEVLPEGTNLFWLDRDATVLNDFSTNDPRPVNSPDTLAYVIYTSGSTGNPKGVMLTHKNIDHASTSITTYLESRRDDVVLSVLPLSFDYGLYQLLMCVKMGATLVLEKSFASLQKILPLLASENITGFPLGRCQSPSCPPSFR